MTAVYSHDRVQYKDAGKAQRCAIEKLNSLDMPKVVMRAGFNVVAFLTSYSKLRDRFEPEKMAAQWNMSRQSLSKALNWLHKLEVIVWSPGGPGRDSWVSVDPADLAGSHVSTVETSHVATLVTSEDREDLTEETEERAPVPAAVPAPPPSDPVIEVAVDALCRHLSPVRPVGDHAREKLRDEFRKLPPGSTLEVLHYATRGRPDPDKIGSVGAYGRTCIETGFERWRLDRATGVSRETLPVPRKRQRGLAPDRHDRTIASTVVATDWDGAPLPMNY